MGEGMIFAVIGGLGLFFFGMKTMSDALKKIAGERLKTILHMVTRVPLVGVLVGAGVTCLIQSSSATSVMVVGFVNAGLLELRQAISVIMGANIGTTFTAWLVSSMSVFKITHYALPAVGIGFAMSAFGRTRNFKMWGQVLMGFGMLFLGLEFLKDTFAPLKDSAQVHSLFATFAHNPLWGILVGTAVTMVLQSSSATIALVQILAFNGVISFPAALPLIIGDNIGTTITAQLAALGTNLNSRRTAMSHTLFNAIGAGYITVFLYNGMFARLIDWIIPGTITLKNIMFHIAVAHSAFNLINAVIFLPFIGIIEKACVLMVPKRKGTVDLKPQYLERHLLDTPPIALDQARRETVRMLAIASRSVSAAVRSLLEKNSRLYRVVPELERAVDNLQTEITQYLIEVSQRNLTPEQSAMLPVLMHSVNDIERIGDHAENIVELTERAVEENLPYNDEAKKELTLMWNELHSMLIETELALKNDDIRAAEKALVREETINIMYAELKQRQTERMKCNETDLKAGVIFISLIENMEKIGDYLSNVAEGVRGQMRWRLQKVIDRVS